MRLLFSVLNLATCAPSTFIDTLPVPESITSTEESPSSILSDAGKFVSAEPSPWNDVAVTELIPDMFVAVSPTMFPFALMFPETVSEPNVPTDVMLV